MFSKKKKVEEKPKPTQYELQIITENQRQFPKTKNVFSNLVDSLNTSLKKAKEFLVNIPGVEKTLENTSEGLTHFLGDLGNWSVNKKEVYSKYALAGYQQVKSSADITALDLEDVELVIGDICKKYQTLAMDHSSDQSEEEASSSDIVALITLNQKAISEFATYYGFDISLEKERVFALNILEYAAATDVGTKEAVMARLVKSTRDMAKGKSISDKNSFVNVLRSLTSSISIQLLKAKLADFLPIQGAVIGGGFNAYFTNEVCDIAQKIYRQRFLIEKYGEDILKLEAGENEEDGNES